MKTIINWFPGHMARANRNILDSLSLVDLVLQVVDARAIDATSNKDFDKISKPVLKVALKQDLADTKSIKESSNIVIGSIKNKGFKQVLLNKINNILKPLVAKKAAKGIKNPTFYLMVVGLPNVGKSSLINFLAGKKVTITGNQPAVTKKQSIIKITNSLFLQDNPGIFFKNITNATEGFKLALVNTVKKEVLPLNEVVEYAYNYMINNYEQEMKQYYKLERKLNFIEFVKFYGTNRCFLKEDNQIDIVRTIEALFDDFVNAKICKVNYEKEENI